MQNLPLAEKIIPDQPKHVTLQSKMHDNWDRRQNLQSKSIHSCQQSNSIPRKCAISASSRYKWLQMCSNRCLNLKSIAMRYCEKKVSHIYISTAACPAGHRCDDQVQTTIASSFSSDAYHHKDYIWSKSKIVWTFRWKFCLFTDEQRALCKALKQKIWRSCALDGSQCAAASPWGSLTAIQHNRLMQTNVAISEHF